MHRNPVRIARALLLLVLQLLCAPASADESFHLVAPTAHRHWLSSRAESARLEVRQMPLEKMGQALISAKPLLSTYGAWNHPKIAVYLSADKSAEQIKVILENARIQFRQAYPGANPRFFVKILPTAEAQVQQLADRADEALDQIAVERPSDEELRAEVQAFKELNHQAVEAALAIPACPSGAGESRVDHLADQVLENAKNPDDTRATVCRFAAIRSALVFVSRAAQVAHVGIPALGDPVTTAVATAAGIALVSTDTVTEYYTVKFQTSIAKLFREHGLPWKLKSPLLAFFSEMYRHSTGFQFLKGLLSNIAVYGMAKPLLMQQLAHAFAPQATPAVASADVGDLAVNSATGAVFFVMGAQGADWLKQKGWITQTHIDLAFRYLGILDVASNFLNSNPALKPYRAFTQWPVWGAYATAFAVSLAMPVRKHRFVLIDADLSAAQRLDVNAMEVTDLTWETGLEGMQAAVEAISQHPSVSDRNWCAKMLSRWEPSPSVEATHPVAVPEET